MESVSKAQYLVEYLYKSRSDICEGIRQLDGDDLREHLLHVLGIVIRVAGFAIQAAMVAASFVPALRELLRKFNLPFVACMSLAKLFAAALTIVGTLLKALDQSQTARAIGTKAEGAGAFIAQVVEMIQSALKEAAASKRI